MHYTWWIFRSFIECILKTNFVQGDDNVLLLLSGPLNSFPNKNMTTRSRLNPSFFEDLIVDHFQFWVTWFRPSFEYIFTCKFTKTAITQNWKRQPRSSKKMKIWSDEFICYWKRFCGKYAVFSKRRSFISWCIQRHRKQIEKKRIMVMFMFKFVKESWGGGWANWAPVRPPRFRQWWVPNLIYVIEFTLHQMKQKIYK